MQATAAERAGRGDSPRLPLVLLLSLAASAAVASCYELTILHTNDLHSRFDEITARGSACRDMDRAAGKCFGGVARIKQTVDEIRSGRNNVVFLNAGDFFQGTVWYSIFKWPIVANLTSSLGYTASSLGNHELDDGVDDLVAYMRATRNAYPTLSCNLELENEPDLDQELRCSVVVEVGGQKIGIMGYLTPETKDLASTGGIVFVSEVEALRSEARRLKSKGVDILIAVGHSGFNEDNEIAREVDELDVVVGGHTNTLLWNGDNPLGEIPVGPYPVQVQQPRNQVKGSDHFQHVKLAIANANTSEGRERFI